MNKETAECAKINFENLEKAVPQIKKHPYYLIAKAQLDESLGYGTVDEILKPHLTEIHFSPEGESTHTTGQDIVESVNGVALPHEPVGKP